MKKEKLKIKNLALAAGFLTILTVRAAFGESIKLRDVPGFPEGTVLFEHEQKFGRRGKIGVFQFPPCKAGIFQDDKVQFDPEKDSIVNDPDFVVEDPEKGSIRIIYLKNDEKLFTGAYIIVMGDLSGYSTITFLIKGAKGGETFEIGMNDTISNKREDAVFVGSIHRYLKEGVTTEWQAVKIPLEDFFGPATSKTFSLVFLFNELGEGSFWIDELRFSDDIMVYREDEIREKEHLLLDNFDHSDLNILGRKTNTYKKLPSICHASRVEEPRIGESGRSLRLKFDKASTGWCGYYTLLNQVDGDYYDLSQFKSVSFMVRGENGGEDFQIGLADKNWIIIGDSLKAGQIGDFLKGGVTTEWQEVKIPLEAFGLLDLTQMGSFVIDFNVKSSGSIYLENLGFNKKSEAELLADW